MVGGGGGGGGMRVFDQDVLQSCLTFPNLRIFVHWEQAGNAEIKYYLKSEQRSR